MPADLRLLGGQPVMLPHAVRRDGVIGRQIFGALAGRHHAQSRWRAPSRPSRQSAPAGRHRPANRPRRPRAPSPASSGPASTSASTLTMTMCLPASIAARAWAMPAAGLPVASMTTSTRSSSQAVAAVVGEAGARDARRVPADGPAGRLGALADRDRRSRATSRPAIVGTCARNIEPNLPAPISPTRTGLPASTRAARRMRHCRFMRHRHSAG